MVICTAEEPVESEGVALKIRQGKIDLGFDFFISE